MEDKWNKILDIRSDVSKALELARIQKLIGHSLDAQVTIFADDENYDFINKCKDQLKEVFIVSEFALEKLGRSPAYAIEGELVKNIK